MSVFQEISDYIDTISVIDTHCHKLPRQVGFPAGIQDLVEHSYLGWCHRDWDGTKEAAAEFVRGLKHNSYFFWIEKSLQKLLGTEQRLDENTYPWFDQKIREFSSSLASDDEFLRMSAIMTRSSWTDIGSRGRTLAIPVCIRRPTGSTSFCSDISRIRWMITATIPSLYMDGPKTWSSTSI